MKTLLQQLQQVIREPVGSLVYVGPGKGEMLAFTRRLMPEQVILYESDPENIRKLERDIDAARERLCPYTLVAGNQSQTDLHILNNTRYNSISKPVRILELRSNLKIEKSISVPARRASQVVSELDLSIGRTNLLILNSLGNNLSILKSIQPELLYKFEWMIVTGLQIEDAYAGDMPITEITEYLSGLGFDLNKNAGEAIYPNAQVLYKRHPLVLKIISQNDSLQSLKQEHDEKVKLLAERQSRIEQMTQARDGQARLANERQAQIQQFTLERDETAKLLVERQSQIEQLTQGKDDQTRLANECQAMIQQITQDRDETAKLLSERQGQIEQLTQGKDDQTRLANERQSKIMQLAQERDEKTKKILEQQILLDQANKSIFELTSSIEKNAARARELEQTNSELQARHNLMDQEIIRAEAQIDLIKDVLLRDSGI